MTMYRCVYGELSNQRKENWYHDDENPFIVLKWEKRIHCADGIAFPSLATNYLRERVQIDWGSFAWKANKAELLYFVDQLSCGKLEDSGCLQDGIEYGVVFIKDGC